MQGEVKHIGNGERIKVKRVTDNARTGCNRELLNRDQVELWQRQSLLLLLPISVTLSCQNVTKMGGGVPGSRTSATHQRRITLKLYCSVIK